MLSPQKIQEYTERMERERTTLLEELKKNEAPEDFGSDTEDNSEEANEAQELGNQISISQVLKERLNEIDGALNRIQTKTYGICKKCGMEISEKLLDLVPESELCEVCKKAS